MAYEPYVTYEYYCDVYKGTVIPMSELDKALKQASRHVDSLTYNRIVGRGFSNLTAFQQDVIQEVVCQQADFEYISIHSPLAEADARAKEDLQYLRISIHSPLEEADISRTLHTDTQTYFNPKPPHGS